MKIQLKNETSTLKAVVLGQSISMGRTPLLHETYDAKSYETVKIGTYPTEEDVSNEMSAFERILRQYNVEVFRPATIQNCNQVFARDVGFVVDDKIIISNIIPNRQDEKEAYQHIFNQISYDKIFNLPEKAHVEGGDVVLYNDTIFVGVYKDTDYAQLKSARTNVYAINFLKEILPEKDIIALELIKHDTTPFKSILHLDCAFMPVSKNKALIYKAGFSDKKQLKTIYKIFGSENIFEITEEEMYLMNTNIFSISPQVVVSEQKFERLNEHLEQVWNIKVERIPYFEVSKMGGLLRCSTFPLLREND
ncbi:MAG: amidinotransferase [Porphyromonadaceae bacterium CG2_30_38_12]|nr:MAG: amidinotransferase [Porphyromonadaceae bacterium CG2_30_38_12]